MKKRFLPMLLVCLLAALPALASEGMTAGEYAKANGYTLLAITDVFVSEDAEMDADGNFPENVTPEVIVQGSFGNIDMSHGEDDPDYIGFDEQNLTYSMGLAEGCVIQMPPDLMNPVELAPCEDFAQWYETQYRPMVEGLSADGTDDRLYVEFTLDENDNLTSVTYLYMP